MRTVEWWLVCGVRSPWWLAHAGFLQLYIVLEVDLSMTLNFHFHLFTQLTKVRPILCKLSASKKWLLAGIVLDTFPTQQGHHHNGDQAAQRPHILCSICVHSFGALAKAVRLLTVSLQSHKMFYPTRTIDILIDLQPFGCNFKGTFWLPALGVRRHGGREWAHSIARSWARITSHWHMWSISESLWDIQLAPKTVQLTCTGYDDNYHSRSYSFVERQKLYN